MKNSMVPVFRDHEISLLRRVQPTLPPTPPPAPYKGKNYCTAGWKSRLDGRKEGGMEEGKGECL